MHRKLLLTVTVLSLLCALSLAAYALTRPLALNTVLGYYVAHTEVAQDACLAEGSLVAGTYNPYRIHPLPRGFVIFYSVECDVPRQPARAFDGQRAYIVDSLSWNAFGRGLGTNLSVSGGALVTYQIEGWFDQELPTYRAVSGQVFTNTVQTVVVTFANGEAKRETPVGGHFAALIPETVMACELQLLDAQGSMIQRYDLALPPPIPASFGTCPP